MAIQLKGGGSQNNSAAGQNSYSGSASGGNAESQVKKEDEVSAAKKALAEQQEMMRQRALAFEQRDAARRAREQQKLEEEELKNNPELAAEHARRIAAMKQEEERRAQFRAEEEAKIEAERRVQEKNMDQTEALIAAIRAQVEKEKEAKNGGAVKATPKPTPSSNNKKQDESKPAYRMISPEEMAAIEEKRRQKLEGLKAAGEKPAEAKPATPEPIKPEPEKSESGLGGLGSGLSVAQETTGPTLNDPHRGQASLSDVGLGGGLGGGLGEGLGGGLGGGLGIDVTAGLGSNSNVEESTVTLNTDAINAAVEKSMSGVAVAPDETSNLHKLVPEPIQVVDEGNTIIVEDGNEGWGTTDNENVSGWSDVGATPQKVTVENTIKKNSPVDDNGNLISVVPVRQRPVDTNDVQSAYNIDFDDDDDDDDELSFLSKEDIYSNNDDEAKRKAEEARVKAEEEARRKAEEEARIKAEEEARRKAEEEARRKAEEEEARRKAEEEEARRKAEEEARRKAEEEEARRKAEEEARRKAEEEARRKAEEEARRKAEEEARRKAEEEARRKAEEEARRKAEEEARRKAEEEARRKAEEEEARRKAEEEARRKAEEEEARRKAEEEEARRKAEEEARRKAEEEARRKAEEEARRKAEEEEARRKAEEEARRKAEEYQKLAEEAARKAEEARIALEAVQHQSAPEEKPAAQAKPSATDFNLPVGAEQYLGKYLSVDSVSEQITDTIKYISENPSEPRNIVILGQYGFGTTTIAEDFARSFYAMGICKTKTIAKIKAGALNRANISDAIGKLQGGCLVVENAGVITPEKLDEIYRMVNDSSNDVVVIMTGQIDTLSKIFKDNVVISSQFKHLIQVHRITDVDVLEISKNHAKDLGYPCEPDAERSLRRRMQEVESGNLDRVLKFVDNAVSKAHNRELTSGEQEHKLIASDFE
ncbi:MAG: hypothetical protein K6G76_02370 [Lachnospiraceae bacterium]|nr:hypothetical protein [Lachnospiraceae bacterium]